MGCAMFCSECGEALADTAKFCAECGAFINDIAAETVIQVDTLNEAHRKIQNSSNSFNPAYIFIGVILLAAAIFFIVGFSNIVSPSNKKSAIEDAFFKTNSGKALLSCVSNSGKLSTTEYELDNGTSIVVVELEKTKKVIMEFSVDESINQAKLTGAKIPDETKVTKFSLMLTLELMCGGEISSQIFSDEYKSLQMLNILG
jgi:hypothetical protein